ncbi:N-ethylammeline chlorohydrolase [Raoultella terrigena]|uniref:N-ethylammeline chlorohydrolase n=1 Tax=Raoultella terrigena TaxID=577 RepID=A0A4V6J1C6_RAOTE|nr:N-ethylammeline chlorohydrolase [Raoultella terrigena]
MPTGEVVYQGDKILFVGHDYPGHIDEEINAGNSLVGPGFIDLDALGDLDTTVLAFDNQPGWRKGRIVADDWLRRDLYSREQLDFAKRYAYSQLLRNGITSFAPITSILYRQWAEDFDEYLYAADVAESLGARAWLGPAFMAGYYVTDASGRFSRREDRAQARRGLDDAQRFYQRLRQRGVPTLSGMLAPDRIEGGDPQWLAELAALVAELACPTRLHCCQSELEIGEIARRYNGKSSLEVLEDVGLLNRRMLLPHGQFLGGERPDPQRIAQDIDRLARSGATVVSCPMVSGRHAKYLEQYPQLRAGRRQYGARYRYLPAGYVQQYASGHDPYPVVTGDIAAASSADYYRMATLGGAKALGPRRFGATRSGLPGGYDRGEPLINLRWGRYSTLSPRWWLSGNGRDVTGTIVAGRKVYWEGRNGTGRLRPRGTARRVAERVRPYSAQLSGTHG